MSETESSEVEHISCRCLNITGTIRVRQREDKQLRGIIDEVQVIHTSLVSHQPAASSSSSSGVKERASKILCANCGVQVLQYDAEAAGAAPLEAGTNVTVDLRDSDKSPLTGRDNIDKLRKNSDRTWSDLFSIIIAVPSVEADGSNDLSTGPGTMRRSSSRDLQASAMAASTFHDKARARIKKDKQELEAQVIRMRAEHDAATRRYLTQADMLAERARTAASTVPRSTSTNAALPGAAKQTSTKASRTLSPRPPGKGSKGPATETASPPLIVQRGGFDTPPVASSSSSTSPKSPRNATGSLATGIPASISAALAGSSQPITSPTLIDDAASYPGLFGAINGKTPSLPPRGKVSPGPVPSSAIAQPSGPQSPSMRRSRSPSPSATGRTASQTREGAPGTKATGTAQVTDRDTNASSKRPALNLDRDVARQDSETNRASEEDARRGRAMNPTSVNMSSSVPRTTHTALSQNPGKNAPTPKRTTSSWLRLNGISPSPPAIRQGMVQSHTMVRTESSSPDKGKARAEEPKSPSEEARPNAVKRHVSFKEPEPPKHNASPEIQHEILEAIETPFELDEEMEDQSDDNNSDSEDNVESSIAAALSGAEAKNRPNTKAYGATATAGTSSSPKTNSHSPGPKTIIGSLSASLQSGKGAQSLAAMLNDPTSFIGSLRNTQRGSANSSNYAGPSSYAQSGAGGGSDESMTGSGSLSGNNTVRLNEQSKRMRDLLGVDAPSHRGRKSKGAQTLQQMLAEEEDNLTDEQLDILAPVSNLATSCPVAIGIPRFNKKEEYEFERKTSVPQKEGLLVPKFKNRHSGAELPVLEEAEERSTSPQPSEQSITIAKIVEEEPKGAVDVPGAKAIRQKEIQEEASRILSEHSPPVSKGDGTTAREDVQTAILNEEDEARGRTNPDAAEREEAGDQVGDLNSRPQGGFVPPHVWSRKTAGDIGMLGTSVYDYE